MPRPTFLLDPATGDAVQYRRADGSTVDLDGAELAKSGLYVPSDRAGHKKVREAVVAIRMTREDIMDSWDGESITIGIDASHGGYWNKNLRNYRPAGMKRYIDTWKMFGGRPYIKDHDYSTAENRLGTVVDAVFQKTGATTCLEQLSVEVSDTDEIDSVRTGRSKAVSVGGKPVEGVICSCCGHDLHNDGYRPRQITFSKKPKASWMDASAFGGRLTNEELWNVEKDEDGKWVGECWHFRGLTSPPEHDDEGADVVGFFYDGVMKQEISKVLFGADTNDDTGEWAHIRGIIDAADAIEDADARAKVIEQMMARVDCGPVDKARFVIVPSVSDLYRAASPADAVRVARGLDRDQGFFDQNLWNYATTLAQDHDGRVEAYHELGGRLVASATKAATGGTKAATAATDAAAPDLDLASVLALTPKDFGAWYRTDALALDAGERRVIERLHARSLVRRRTPTT